MNSPNMRLNSPNFKALLLIVLILIFSTALRKCAAQTVIDNDVLKYLLGRSAKAYYMEKDIKLADSVICEQKHIITYNDSIISNQSESFRISQFENEMCNVELNSANSVNKKLTRKVKFFKFTTYLVGALGTISCTYFILH